MHISKLFIKEEEIPIKKGTLRKVNYEHRTMIEVELIVHPTVINFINTLNYTNEQVTILSKQNVHIKGEFDIHTRQSSILLVGNPNKIEGIDHLSSVSYEKSTFTLDSGEGIPLDDELQEKQESVLINILETLLERNVQDKGNQFFIHTLLDKLKKGEKLNSFDEYIKNEIRYLVEKAFAAGTFSM